MNCTKTCLLAVGLSLPALAGAQNAFVGTWKTDISHNLAMPDKTFDFLLNKGVYHCQSCTPPYEVKADGNDHKVSGHPYYDTVGIKVVDERTIAETDKKAGKTVTQSTYSISSDGKTLTIDNNDSSNTSGPPVTVKVELTQVSKGPAGSHALSGSWKATKFDSLSDSGALVTYALDGAKLKMTTPTGQSYDAPLDGTESPFMGDPGQDIVAMKRVDDHTIDETDKRNGKVIGTARITVSPDGKTMTVAWKDMMRGSSGSFTNIKQ